MTTASFLRATLALALASTWLAGCGAARPVGLALGAKRPAARGPAIREAEPQPAGGPEIEPELRLAITEDAFTRLRAAFPFEAQTPRVDHDYDLWDGRAFRRAVDPTAPRLRLKVRPDKVTWQVSRVLERRTLDAAGLPIGLTTLQSEDGSLSPGAARALLEPTERFFLQLDEGGERLRQQAAGVDFAWRALPWSGAPAFGWAPAPLLAGPPLAAADALPPATPMLVPAATKRRHGWKTLLPREQVGGGLRLFLHFDEARDEVGRWRDSFEVEAEPTERTGREALEAAAAELGRLLAAHGITRGDVAPQRGDATAYTADRLTLLAPTSPFVMPALQGLRER
ncbi:MAG: hypothetical protein VKS61_11260 [Candidatus Sericytochromatia bacterium]|nr:hypothetical protein [Candidatus Sericytochromatia bacterium]